MKVALYISDPSLLFFWQVKLIENLLESTNCEVLLVITPHEKKNHSSVSSAINYKLISFIFRIQYFIENKIFNCNSKFMLKSNSEGVLERIKNKLILNNPIKIDLYNEDLLNIINYKLDIILSLQNEKIPKDLLSIPKHGIWGLSKIFDLGKSSSIPITKLFSNKPTINIDLIRYVSEDQSYIKIDSARFNKYWSLLQINEMILGTLPLFVLKNLNHFSETEQIFNPKKTQVFSAKNNSYSLILFFRYMFSFYFKLVIKFMDSVFNINRFQWSLFIGFGSVMDIDSEKLFELKPSKNHFWADPFLFSYKNKNYVFFENYSYSTKKAVISCGEIIDCNLCNIIDVLILDYHLSYPYVFEEENEIYMIPETSENKRLEIYKCIEFPHKWELYSTGFENEGLCDTFFYKDNDNHMWIFTNKSSSSIENYNNELYIYKIDSLRLNNIQAHKKNPVIINSNYARNGGCLFEFDKKIIRPCQKNVNGVYGYGLNLRSIELLSIDDYKEKSIKEISPNNMKGFHSIHHLHQMSNIFIIDGISNRKKLNNLFKK